MEREPSRSPSVLWSLFTKKDRCTATCNTCHNDYSYKTSITNLKKHWEQKHGALADIIKDSNSDNSDGEHETSKSSSMIWSLFTKKDRSTATCNACHNDYSYKSSITNLKTHWRLKHGNLAEITRDSNSDNSDGEHEPSRSPSVLWSLFTKKDRCTATCNTCHNDYSYKSSITNLRKHWEHKHGDLADIIKDSNSDNSDGEHETSKSSSMIWTLFTKKDRSTATCNACHNDYSYKSSITNLKTHWRLKHGNLADITRDSNSDNSDGEHENSYLKSKSNPTWKYYEVLDSDKFEATCKLCGENIPYETVKDLAKHVRDHGEQTKDSDDEDDDDNDEIGDDTEIREVKPRRRNSKLWQYFKIIDNKTKLASCIFCSRVLSFSGTITNLKRHLVRKHPQVKKMVVSANGNIYEVDTGDQLIAADDDEKDPIEMDTVYLEDLDDTMDQIRTPQITVKSSRKKAKYPIKRPFSQIAKEPVKNSNATLYDEPLPKQNKPDTMGTLDYFGQYVISLLREMPQSAAEQLQNDIIMQIFAKKAALAPQTSNKHTITESDIHLRDSDEIETEPVTVTIHELREVTEHHEDRQS